MNSTSDWTKSIAKLAKVIPNSVLSMSCMINKLKSLDSWVLPCKKLPYLKRDKMTKMIKKQTPSKTSQKLMLLYPIKNRIVAPATSGIG